MTSVLGALIQSETNFDFEFSQKKKMRVFTSSHAMKRNCKVRIKVPEFVLLAFFYPFLYNYLNKIFKPITLIFISALVCTQLHGRTSFITGGIYMFLQRSLSVRGREGRACDSNSRGLRFEARTRKNFHLSLIGNL